MAIGKNAIKRVENNGYSKVQTTAPDMENSHVIANPDTQVTEVLVAPVEAATAAKTAKATATKKPAAKKVPTKKAEGNKDRFERVEVGADMPYYLL